ncbi:MAG TPA: DUF6188 family protein [Candidatus Binatia bacterium]|jgi:hypothetical protein
MYYLIERDDLWEIPLRGKPVGRFLIDSALKLEFLEPVEEETTVVIEGGFSFEHHGKKITLDVQDPTSLCGVFLLYRKIVESAVAYKSGILTLQFVEGERLIVPPDPKGNYESWEIVGSNGLRMVCKPSGGLSVWQPSIDKPSGGDVH